MLLSNFTNEGISPVSYKSIFWAKKLREIYLKKKSEENMTQEDIAAFCDVSQGSVCGWMQSDSDYKHEPHLGNLYQLCKLFDLHPWDFIRPEVKKELDKKRPLSTISSICDWDKLVSGTFLSRETCKNTAVKGIQVDGKRHFLCMKHFKSWQLVKPNS